MADAQPLTVQSVSRALQQRRELTDIQVSRRDLRVVPDIARLLGRTTPETCQFYGRKDVRGCYEPRSCRDCLQRVGCMVSGYTCRSEGLYSPANDYRRIGVDANGATVSNTSSTSKNELSCYSSGYPYVSFPSSTTEYCTISDSACPKSRIERQDTFFYEDIATRVGYYKRRSPYCVGIDGCVCISGCEDAAAFSELVDLTQCRLAGARESSFYISLVSSMLGLMTSIVMAFLWVKKSRERINTSRDGPSSADYLCRHMLDQAPALSLDLYGWRFFYNEILRKEDELLAGAQDVSPVARPRAFEFDAIPTAPDFEVDDESSAPTITDPHALASAPVFRLEYSGGSDGDWGDRAGGRLVEDVGVPSAPDFE